MITINLKPGSKRAKAGSPLAGGLSQLKALPGRIKDPWPMAAVAAWVLAIGFLGYVGVSTSMRVNTLEPEIDAARGRARFRCGRDRLRRCRPASVGQRRRR